MSTTTLPFFFFAIVFFFFPSTKIYSIDVRFIDSVENVVNTTKDRKARLQGLYHLTFEYGFFNPKKGIKTGNILLKEATEAKDSFMIFCAYNGISNCYETMMMFDSSLYLNELALALCKQKSNNCKRLYPVYANIAYCHKKLGHYDIAIEYYKKAEDCANILKERNLRVFYYVSDLYLRVNNIEKAKEYIVLGMTYTQNIDYDYIKPILHSYLGYCYSKSSKPDSAFYYLHKSIHELKTHTDTLSYANALGFIADAHLQYGHYDSASIYYNQSIVLYRKLGNVPLENHCNIKNTYALASLSYNASKVARTLHLAEKNLYTYGSNYDLLLDSYAYLSKSFEKIKYFDKALFYIKTADSLTQKILNNESIV